MFAMVAMQETVVQQLHDLFEAKMLTVKTYFWLVNHNNLTYMCKEKVCAVQLDSSLETY